jgi:hypothetical protein
MICTNKDKLAEIIASRVGKTCSTCDYEGDCECIIFGGSTINIYNDKGVKLHKLEECKEMFKEVSDETNG